LKGSPTWEGKQWRYLARVWNSEQTRKFSHGIMSFWRPVGSFWRTDPNTFTLTNHRWTL